MKELIEAMTFNQSIYFVIFIWSISFLTVAAAAVHWKITKEGRTKDFLKARVRNLSIFCGLASIAITIGLVCFTTSYWM